MRKPAEAMGHLFLVAAQSRAHSASAKDQAEVSAIPAREMVIDGRRYHLIPAEAEPSETDRRPRAALAEILTARELQIVALVAEGRINKQIAADLQISEWTVSTHLRRVFAKLDVDTRAAMVSKCFDALKSRAPD
jgi:DNA-binding CsgD family transcriptional regulator